MNNEQFKLDIALYTLNVLILEKGIEFPEAVRLTLRELAVSRAALIAAYDAQP